MKPPLRLIGLFVLSILLSESLFSEEVLTMEIMKEHTNLNELLTEGKTEQGYRADSIEKFFVNVGKLSDEVLTSPPPSILYYLNTEKAKSDDAKKAMRSGLLSLFESKKSLIMNDSKNGHRLMLPVLQLIKFENAEQKDALRDQLIKMLTEIKNYKETKQSFGEYPSVVSVMIEWIYQQYGIEGFTLTYSTAHTLQRADLCRSAVEHFALSSSYKEEAYFKALLNIYSESLSKVAIEMKLNEAFDSLDPEKKPEIHELFKGVLEEDKIPKLK